MQTPVLDAALQTDRETYVDLYRSMLRIRLAEERIAEIYPSDKIQSPIHLCIGQEAIAAGACRALALKDHVYGTYRGHGIYLAKGGDMGKLFAELYAKDGGCCRGRGGSMHMTAPEIGLMGCSAIVASTIPVAVGAALASRMRGDDRVIVTFFGDGAVDEGVFFESMNFAVLKKLPVVFVCENNNYAVHSRLADRHRQTEIFRYGEGLGLAGRRLDGNDVGQVYASMSRAVREVREGGAPLLMEYMTYRWSEHVGPGADHGEAYRDKEKLALARAGDPLARAREELAARYGLSAAEIDSFEAPVRREIDQAVAFAEGSPLPEAADLREGLFLEERAERRFPASIGKTSRLTYGQALERALHQAMEMDPSVFVMGIGADDHKALFNSAKGILARFGPERIFDTPIAEGGMTGVAIGAALEGLKPVHVHIRADFLYLAMDQLFNMAAKWRYMFGSRMSVPLTVRAVIGRSWGQGAQHSQNPVSQLMHVPGLKVVMPTTPHDAKGCLLASIFDPNPVVMIEHRLLYDIVGEVPDAPYETPFGKAFVRRQGRDLTIVANSYMVVESLKASEFLAEHGIEAEVVDPVSLSPLDEATILASTRKTGRLLVVDSSWLACGASAEIAALAAEKAFDALKQPIRRIGQQAVPCPVSKPLENAFYPDARTIAGAAFEMLGRRMPDVDVPKLTHKFKGPF